MILVLIFIIDPMCQLVLFALGLWMGWEVNN
jgi:hypothetical protein